MKRRTLTNILLTFFVLILGLGLAGFVTNWFTDFSPFTPIDTTSDTVSDSSSEDPTEQLSYSITFAPSTTNTVLLDGDGIKAIGSSDAQLMSYITTEKLYREAPDSIKFGTSSVKGVLAFELPERERILSVVIEARSYAGDNTTLKVNDVEQALTTSKAEYEFDYSALETATVNITSKNNTSNRFYVSAITIIHSGEEITEPAEPVYHRVEAQKYEIVLPVQQGDFQQRFEVRTAQVSTFEWLGEFINIVLQYDDSVGTFDFLGDEVAIAICLLDGSLDAQSEFLVIMPGQYGRYVISETQVADEPIAYTLEPIYDYVLAE